MPLRYRNRALRGCCAVCEIRGVGSRSSVLSNGGDCGAYDLGAAVILAWLIQWRKINRLERNT
jgi:hypothetical protein